MSERQIEKIINLMQTDDSADAPKDAIRWAKNLFAARAITAPRKSIVQKVLAVLQMDLSPGQAAFGERSASASKARQMLFRAGDNALDIRISPSKKGFNLRGQILGEGFAGATVRIGAFEAAANQIGEFEFAEIAGGKYDLIARIGEKEIVVQDLEIK